MKKELMDIMFKELATALKGVEEYHLKNKDNPNIKRIHVLPIIPEELCEDEND